MQILYTAFESDPFMKTGGLADVAGSMPSALKNLGDDIDIRIMLPKYAGIPQQYQENMQFLGYCYVDLAWRHEYCGIFQLEYHGLIWYFLDSEKYFGREALYGYNDEAERMAFFSKACLESCLHLKDFAPDIIHSHDWHTTLVPVFLRECFMETKLSKARTVFTIHNLKFQGIYDPFIIGDILGLNNTPADAQLRQYKDYSCCTNYMMGGCIYADRITTVSPSYAEEICTPYFGEGLDWLFRNRRSTLRGILNGIDVNVWNPAQDSVLADTPGFQEYSLETVQDKVSCKLALQKELGLKVSPDIPMYVIISRLTEQKGLDLVTYLLPHIVESEMQLVVLGTGDYHYEEAFQWYAGIYPDKISAQITFNNSLSHRLYAAADVMLVPSRFEPCGLTQMIAMRYGTLPLVRETGGLKDTVNNENGFSFLTFNADDLKYTLDCSLDIWYNHPDEWKRKQANAMKADHSWTASAKEYLDLYQELLQEA